MQIFIPTLLFSSNNLSVIWVNVATLYFPQEVTQFAYLYSWYK